MRNRKGFTLIELMIVIAIIAAIAISAFQGHSSEVNMGTNGGTLANAPVSYLVCKDSTGAETKREPAITGERWSFEGGSYVTTDANGNPRTFSAATNDCTIQ